MTCHCNQAHKTFHCPYCKRDVCLCEACYLDDNTPPLCMWCADTANDWPAPQRELLRRELAYYQSGKAEDAEAIDEMLVRPSSVGLWWKPCPQIPGRWLLKRSGQVGIVGDIWHAPHFEFRATVRERLGGYVIGRDVHTGTIRECALALTQAVTK